MRPWHCICCPKCLSPATHGELQKQISLVSRFSINLLCSGRAHECELRSRDNHYNINSTEPKFMRTHAITITRNVGRRVEALCHDIGLRLCSSSYITEIPQF